MVDPSFVRNRITQLRLEKGASEYFIVLLYFHAENHIHQCIHVPILGGALENDIGNQSTVQKRFRLRPKRITLLALAFGIGNQRIHKFEDVGLILDIGQRIVVHGFCEINGIEHFVPIPVPL